MKVGGRTLLSSRSRARTLKSTPTNSAEEPKVLRGKACSVRKSRRFMRGQINPGLPRRCIESQASEMIEEASILR